MGIGNAERRLVLPQFLSSHQCKELEFIHKSCGVVGYRPFVLSTTMSHLVATNCANLIIPMLSVRERVKEAVEEHFGCEYDLFTEFTGLISWTAGGNIGWHSDSNRQYLQQRHYSAVCYLNNYEEDFKGGLFHFQEGEPTTIIPSIGVKTVCLGTFAGALISEKISCFMEHLQTVVIYTADERNIHKVDEVMEGERCTLALWFTLDRMYDEDQKLIQMLSTVLLGLEGCLLEQGSEQGQAWNGSRTRLWGPIAASSVMYNLNVKTGCDEMGDGELRVGPCFDISIDDLRIARITSKGFSCCFTSANIEDQLDKPVVLMYKQTKVPHMFPNILEALQVLEFHGLRSEKCYSHWKQTIDDAQSSEPHTYAGLRNTETSVAEASRTRRVQDLGCTLEEFTADTSREPLTRECSGGDVKMPSAEVRFDDLLDSIREWNFYAHSLWGKLFELLPSWRESGSL